MMALSDEPRSEGDATGALGPLARMVLIGTLVVLSVFALGALTGMAVRIFEEDDISTRQLLAGGLAVATIAASLWIIARLRRATRDEPVPGSVRKSNRLLWISLLLGVALGMFMALGSDLGGSDFDLTSNQPISPAIAGIVVAVWLVTLPVLTVRFYRRIDEHALEAYYFGALIALHLFFIAAPVWWFGWRGGFLPAPDMMLVYVVLTAVWCVAWGWRRYR